MDFIERLFHVAPDHGNGLLELAIIAACLLVPMAITILRKKGKATSPDSLARDLRHATVSLAHANSAKEQDSSQP